MTFMQSAPRRTLLRLAAITSTLAWVQPASAFVYTAAGVFEGVNFTRNYDAITHIPTYDGTGGHHIIRVGITPTSLYATELAIPLQNALHTWNQLSPTTNNLTSQNVPSNKVDVETVLLHELGHTLGLGHINLGTESGLNVTQRNFAKSERGADGQWNLGAGPDNIIGTRDDQRGDDGSLNRFAVGFNDPFALNLPSVIDKTTYTRNLAHLPVGDSYVAIGRQPVSVVMGYAPTEAAMQQSTEFGEARRALTADDVAGIRYAMSGLDEIANTADDYTFSLQFVGITNEADIKVRLATTSNFAEATDINLRIVDGHYYQWAPLVTLNQSYPSWFFNPVLVPEPSMVCLCASLSALTLLRRVRGIRFGSKS